MRETCTACNNNSLFDSLIFDISDCLKKQKGRVEGDGDYVERGSRDVCY